MLRHARHPLTVLVPLPFVLVMTLWALVTDLGRSAHAGRDGPPRYADRQRPVVGRDEPIPVVVDQVVLWPDDPPGTLPG